MQKITFIIINKYSFNYVKLEGFVKFISVKTTESFKTVRPKPFKMHIYLLSGWKLKLMIHISI